MLKNIIETLSESPEFNSTTTALLAVSGGIDSMVLLHLLHSVDIKIAVAHLNYKLRGPDSDKDALFVKNKVINDYKLQYHEKEFDLIKYTEKNKLSIQKAAREIRYNWFKNLLKEHQYSTIITAHHANDSIETFIYNLTKGTGLKGLRGIPKVNGNIIRPLSNVFRYDILQYAKENNITWREDISNQSDYYARNHIRHKVIPQLQNLNPKFNSRFIQTIEILKQSFELLQYYSKELYKNIVTEHSDDFITIPLNEVKAIPGHPTLLYQWLEHTGIHSSQINKILNENIQSGKIFDTKTHQILINRGQILIRTNSNPNTKDQNTHKKKFVEKTQPKIQEIHQKDTLVINDNWILHLESNAKIENFKKTSIDKEAFFNSNKIFWPIFLRKWIPGDRFQPLGLKGKSKKISDYLTDQKVNQWQKENIYVLSDQEKILWIVGHTIDHRVRILPSNCKALHIQWTLRND